MTGKETLGYLEARADDDEYKKDFDRLLNLCKKSKNIKALYVTTWQAGQPNFIAVDMVDNVQPMYISNRSRENEFDFDLDVNKNLHSKHKGEFVDLFATVEELYKVKYMAMMLGDVNTLLIDKYLIWKRCV